MNKTVLVAALVLAAPVAQADEAMIAAMRSFADTNIRPWTQDAILVEAIRTQNSRTSGLSQSDIDSLDLAWRAEVGAPSTPTISPVLENAAADFLRGIVDAAGGTVTEVFIMDARGLNVAASAVTSDYWQGDEDKHSATFGLGPDAVHIGEIEFDESTQSYQSQISLTITDPATGQPIGALTVGVNPEALF